MTESDGHFEQNTVHVDELSDYNPAHEGEWAVDDDGNRFLVTRNEFNSKTTLVSERYVLTDEKRRQREGVGAACAGCGEEIGIHDVIVNDKRDDETTHYHCRCYDQ